MKKIYFSFVFVFLMGGNLFAQTVTHDVDYVLADIDAWISNSRTIASTDSTQPYVLISKSPNAGILIFPVDGEKRDSVGLDLYFYVADAATPVNIDVMLGSDNIVDTTSLSTINLSDYTRIYDKISIPNKNVYTSFDVTESYNAAVDAGKSTITFLIGVDPTDETNTELKFRVQRQRDGYKTNAARLALKRNCVWYEIAIDTILCEGTTLNIHDKILTENGVIVDTVTNECGSEDIFTYHAMFISSDPVTNDIAICPGTSYKVQIGPRTFSTYTETGTYIETIEADGCQKIITTNLTLNPQPEEIGLGDDQEIRESQSYTLDAGPGFSSYKWLNDGKVIEGEESQQLVVIMSKDAFHTGINEVEVIVTNEYGCEAGSNVVWIDIKGNLFAPVQDAYAEEITDKFHESTALRVKKDTYIEEEGHVPQWNRETFLQFDLSNEEITSDMSNYRLRLYLYSVNVGYSAIDADGNFVIETPFYQPVACQFSEGGYDPAGNWASRPPDRTTLSAPVNIRIDSLEAGFVEWDINETFVNEILNKNIDVFTVILSAPTDQHSHLSTYRSSEYNDISVRPAIVYDVSGATSNKDVSIDEKEVIIYPNPAKQRLHIQSTYPFSDYSIVDITGRVIVSKPLNTRFVDVSYLKSGSYIIRLKNEKYVETKLFIKE